MKNVAQAAKAAKTSDRSHESALGEIYAALRVVRHCIDAGTGSAEVGTEESACAALNLAEAHGHLSCAEGLLASWGRVAT